MKEDADIHSLITGKTWQEFSDSVRKLGDIVWNDAVPETALERSEGALYLLRFLSAGLRVCVELDDPDHPLIDYNIYNRMSWGLDNPDCNYSYARLEGDTGYRIFGDIGNARNIEFQVTSGHHADGNFTQWQSISALRGSDIPTTADGKFELCISPEKPAENISWMPTSEEANFLLIREFFDDWENQRPASLFMEKIETTYPPQALRAGKIARHFELLQLWLQAGAHCWDDFAKGIMNNQPADIQPFLPPADAAALGGQAYGMGAFQLDPEEAIILQFTPPSCLVWGISLCDRFFQSIDFDHHQSSLNSRQAQMESDTCLMVISHKDPGIHNWLDCAGRENGIIAVRYVLTEETPAVSYQKVRLDKLNDYLPENIPHCSAEQRSELLRQRRLAYQKRTRR